VLNACLIERIFGSPRKVEQYAEEVVTLSREHGFPSWLATGTAYLGWSLAALGDAAQGLDLIGKGISLRRETGAGRRARVSGRLWLANSGLSALDPVALQCESRPPTFRRVMVRAVCETIYCARVPNLRIILARGRKYRWLHRPGFLHRCIVCRSKVWLCVIIWFLMWAALGTGYWICLLLAAPASGFLVRLFMIQHDCGHGSFFRRRLANDWVGRAIGVLTLTPYDFWRRSHAHHHANSGNLDHRGFGDFDTLTVPEFLALPRWRQLLYRLYRHPLVSFGIGPAYLFILRHRLPVGLMRSTWQFWLSTMATNLAIAVLAASMIWLVGLGPFLLVQLPITLIAGSIGVWLSAVGRSELARHPQQPTLPR
jgi:hypothetical protein